MRYKITGVRDMKLKLKLYERTGAKISTNPQVSFMNKGLRFNVASYEKFLKGKKAVELFWDQDNLVVGFRFLTKETPNSFSVRSYRQSGSPLAVVSATRFLADNKISDYLKDRKSFPLEEYEDLVIVRIGGDAQ